MSDTDRVTYARPGQTVRFECGDCIALYERTVQPRRNVARAIARLDEGNVDRAKQLLAEALEDLTGLAEFLNDRATGGAS